MKIVRCSIIIILFLTALVQVSKTQEIKQQPIKEQKAIPVAYLDMNRVFEQHPQTIEAKKEFKKELDMIQKNIDEIREQIMALKVEIVDLKRQENILKPFYSKSETDSYFVESVIKIKSASGLGETINNFTFSSARMSLAPLDAERLQKNIRRKINTKYITILEQDKMILDIKRQSSKDMLRKQQIEVNAILADIYKKTKRYAENANIETIVNKKSLLYGQDEMPDITAEFIKILKIEHDKGAFKLKFRSREEAQNEKIPD